MALVRDARVITTRKQRLTYFEQNLFRYCVHRMCFWNGNAKYYFLHVEKP